jgi:hypothetical protein
MVLPALRIAALALLFLLTSLHAVDPYSELSYRTFLSLSAKNIPPNNPTSVEVSVVATYLNFSFYSELEKDKVRAIADTSHLFQPDTFTKNDRYSGVFLYNNSTLAFTFNGNDIVDSGGHTICNPVYTNAQGKASCIIEFFRNPDPNDPTPVPFSSLPSCGYVRVKAPEKFIGSTLYQSGSATITVCPKNNLAISAFGPAIISAFDPGSPQGLQNLAICFPSLLIAGILMASMYYSGRDPLSLFDITTPRLPKGQTFKIKAGATPQMLRQVLRRYAMLKKQAKADTEKLFVKLVKMSSEYQNASLTGKIGLAMAAKRQARAFYNDLEKATRLTKATGGIQTLQLNDKKRQLGEMMRNVSGLDKDSWDRKKKQRWGTMTNMAFHSFNIFTMAENARRTMGAARGPTGKGNLFSRQVNKFMEKAGDGVVSLEGTPVMRFLGKVPLVRKVVAIPGKAVDVSLGWIAAKRGIKSVARELKGGAIFMAGQTKLGRPIYDSVKKGFLDKEGKDTKFGKFTTWLTGWNFGQFEGRHDLSKIKLQSFQNVFHQNVLVALAAHNREYLELVAALGGDRIERERQRSIKDKEEAGKELKNKIKVLTDSLTGKISRSKDPKAISKLEKALHALEEIKSHPSYKKLDSESIKTLGDKIRNFLTQTNALRANQKDEIRGILKRMEDAAALENSKNTLIKNINGSDTTQKMALMELHKRYADAIKETKENPKERAKREKDAALLLEQIEKFGRAEKIFGLFGKMNGEDIPLFRLQDGKYRLLAEMPSKQMLKSD